MCLGQTMAKRRVASLHGKAVAKKQRNNESEIHCHYAALTSGSAFWIPNKRLGGNRETKKGEGVSSVTSKCG